MFGRLSLLNTTVAQLAKWVNLVLTMAYRDIYGEEEGEEPSQLTLLTSPLSSTEEVVNLYAAGLAPIEVAMPAVLHAIGATPDAIEKATKEAKDRQSKKDDCVDCAEEEGKIGLELANEEKRINNSNLDKKQKLELQVQQENLRQSKASAKEKSEGGGGGGGGGGGSSSSKDGTEESKK